jgi:hypothetical protein
MESSDAAARSRVQEDLMRKLIATTLAGLTLIAVIALTPATASATGYEDSLDDCSYPKIFDALFLRPVGFTALMFGAATLPLSIPLTLWPATVNKDDGQFVNLMIVPAAKFTFSRRLGECSSGSNGY